MAQANVFVTLIFLTWVMNGRQLVAGGNGEKYVRKACRVTRYRGLCIHSLSSFSKSAKSSPSKWARAGVSVTLSETKSVAHYLLSLKKQTHSFKGRNRVALSDCIECFQNAIDQLHKSLGVLRRLSKTTFDSQMSDLNTWLSAALTDADTCFDGFQGEQPKSLQNRVLNATHITSNALALVNKLAATGLGSLTPP